MGRVVNKNELAEIIGFSERSLTEWQEEDPPLPVKERAEKRGLSNKYDTADVFAWYAQRQSRTLNFESPRDRLARLQSESLELQLAEKRGQLVNLAQLEPELSRMVAAFRSELLARDDKLKADLDALYGINLDLALITEHTRNALRQFARYDPEPSPPDARAPAVQASANTFLNDESKP